MAKYSDVQRLQIILKYVNRIKEVKSLRTVSLETIQADFMLESVICLSLERIGEMCYKLSDEIKHQYTFVPWAQIAGMRHVLVHDYENIDLSIAVKIIDNNLLPLELYTKTILQILGAPEKYHDDSLSEKEVFKL